MSGGHVIFVVNLLQDVSVLRPLMYMAANDLNRQVRFLVTAAFRKRDTMGTWQAELDYIAADIKVEIFDFENPYEALRALPPLPGVVVAASESHLKAHQQVHDLFRILPSRFVKITLQHGFECVGFLQSRDQDIAHGASITFAADIVCGWAGPERLVSMAPSQRHKLQVTGPTSVLQIPPASAKAAATAGLVCENMHSPRLNAAGDFKVDFLDIFSQFCGVLAKRGRQVALRPHPGGQYMLKNAVPLPPNVKLHNGPIYHLDLSQFAYGISAPSSILIDMVLAGIPTAVWQDAGSVMDLGNYEGLTRISSLREWLAFGEDAIADPQPYLERQRIFLERQMLIVDRDRVYRAYAGLLTSASSRRPAQLARRPRPDARIQFFNPGLIPTLQLSFLKPLALDVAAGTTAIDVVSEVQLIGEHKDVMAPTALAWLQRRIDSFDPTVVVFCRWASPQVEGVLSYLAARGTPVIYHLDDDLLSIPKEIGLTKWAAHNRPERLAAVRYLLDNVDLVYCSTGPLKRRLEELEVSTPIRAGAVYCTASPLRDAVLRPVRKVGYMGIGHEGDLAMVLPAIVRYLRRNPEVNFDIFGTIPIPSELAEFGTRITRTPKIENYGAFLEEFARFEWDIGICPLAPIPFNLLKANTKWVEYTAVGAAVIASKATVYDDCCADDCGLLASSEDEWLEALETLTHNPDARAAMVQRAQKKLLAEYSVQKLREQVWAILGDAAARRGAVLRQARSHRREHVMFVSDADMPTLQRHFVQPLAALAARGEVSSDFLFEDQMRNYVWKRDGFASRQDWIAHRLTTSRPSLLVFSGYSGPSAEQMLDIARELDIPTIYHVYDGPLTNAAHAGAEKHRHPISDRRQSPARILLDRCDLVYAATPELGAHLAMLHPQAAIATAENAFAGTLTRSAENRPVTKIGYVAGAGASHSLSDVLGALGRLMRKNKNVLVELAGDMSVPRELAEFGERIERSANSKDEQQSLLRNAEISWEIAVCPVAANSADSESAVANWVEYSSAGAAVVASRGTAYDHLCTGGAGILAGSEDEWFEALDLLTREPETRYRQVQKAQQKLIERYSVDNVRDQVLAVFARAHSERLAARRRVL